MATAPTRRPSSATTTPTPTRLRRERARARYDVAGGRIPLGPFSDPGDDDEAVPRALTVRVADRFFDPLGLEEDASPE